VAERTATATGGDVRHASGRSGRLRLSIATAGVPIVWLISVVAAIVTRPLLPIDETRYASVAWEMWRSGDYLVPHLNGAAYSDKPPLLFWLIAGGWRVLGPVETWARLIGPAGGLASVALTISLANRLWPERSIVRYLAPMILASTVVWWAYATLLLFDTVLTTCVLLAVTGLVDARRGRPGGLAFLAVGIGLGLLAKGPVVFIHVLPAMLLARWWDVRRRPVDGLRMSGGWSGWRWSLALTGATLAGAAIALAWAIPAAKAGGPEYAKAIFIGQTAGRVVNSFAHRRPLWWYAPNLLWMLLPWAAWPLLWRSLKALLSRHQLATDAGLRLCVAIVIPALAVFSIVSGKQVHYLLPDVPFVALAIARLVGDAAENSRDDRILRRVSWLALGTFVATTLVALAASPTIRDRYDLRPVAEHLSAAEEAGGPIAHEGRYAGEYTFLGRLRGPLAEIPTDSVAGWLVQHPNGRVVTYARSPNAAGPGVPALVRRFGARYVIVRAASSTLEKASRLPGTEDSIRQPPRKENP
jgi:4-amino-4-deoxy-L-arabinose transferase-like glycosyltransferase